MGVSMAKVTSVSTHSLSSNKITLQAHQLASDKAELLKSETYSSLASQGKKAVAGSLYYDEVTVGKETAMPSNQNIKEKPCRVNVYYGDESIPRATLSFNRYSVSQNESSIPKGTILPWYGSIGNIPNGFALCDGTNGTPDLRNRFIVGAGDTYKLSDIGGKDAVKLEPSQTSSHYHTFGYHNGNNNGYFITTASKKTNASLPSGTYPAKWNGSGGGGWYGWDGSGWNGGQNLVTSLTVATEAQKPHENRPPYYALYYLMKL